MSTYVEKCGGGNPEETDVRIDPDSETITFYMGTMSNGQGHDTSYKQIMSDGAGAVRGLAHPLWARRGLAHPQWLGGGLHIRSGLGVGLHISCGLGGGLRISCGLGPAKRGPKKLFARA